MPTQSDRIWDGQRVGVVTVKLSANEQRPVKVHMTTEAARTLALALGRLKQTTFALPGDVQELLTALDYVMVGDPHSRRKYAEMEAEKARSDIGKGMTPDGGYKAPENGTRLYDHPGPKEYL